VQVDVEEVTLSAFSLNKHQLSIFGLKCILEHIGYSLFNQKLSRRAQMKRFGLQDDPRHPFLRETATNQAQR